MSFLRRFLDTTVTSQFRVHIVFEFIALWVVALILYMLPPLMGTDPADMWAALPILPIASIIAQALSATLLAALARFVIGRRAVVRESCVFVLLCLIFLPMLGPWYVARFCLIGLCALLLARLLKNLCPLCRGYE